ncbi:DUF2834 domain-containing protein [Rhodalgimonas zhirmunskyi]|uniref:DUF2834 domain-containing protein n=1 Tax=Rhodalgimonas zhirmunskyi TaxID=2964767 RepID=A0AAJ1U754_9RHOB|nr:DUF2834 domain-containing protein [Rhodoalgimonas zhirmunskyi]MDQ2094726.1 DUF2834 domain-containing protein [Rhodoalgimonas zhirmunskyi]
MRPAILRPASYRYLFLALAVWGAIHPMSHFLNWFAENGFDLPGMIEAWHVNAATSGLVWDLTISAVVLTLWVLIDCFERRRWAGLIAIPATFCIGVSCGLPLYLYFRLDTAARRP